MRLNRATEDTFVFAKQFLIEGMRDVHHWDPAYFWPMFGGKVLRIR